MKTRIYRDRLILKLECKSDPSRKSSTGQSEAAVHKPAQTERGKETTECTRRRGKPTGARHVLGHHFSRSTRSANAGQQLQVARAGSTSTGQTRRARCATSSLSWPGRSARGAGGVPSVAVRNQLYCCNTYSSVTAFLHYP